MVRQTCDKSIAHQQPHEAITPHISATIRTHESPIRHLPSKPAPSPHSLTHSTHHRNRHDLRHARDAPTHREQVIIPRHQHPRIGRQRHGVRQPVRSSSVERDAPLVRVHRVCAGLVSISIGDWGMGMGMLCSVSRLDWIGLDWIRKKGEGGGRPYAS